MRRVRLRTNDPRLEQIAYWQRTLSQPPFFFGWDYIRRYRPAEMASARAFLLARLATFEPEGESCGTAYDDGEACISVDPFGSESAAFPVVYLWLEQSQMKW